MDEGDARSVPATERLAGERGPCDRIPEVGYLDVTNTARYRVIMRYFYDRKRRHHTEISFQEVLGHVQPLFPEYGEAACVQDLAWLVKSRNPDEDFDRTVEHARGVADVSHGNMFYAITQVGTRAEEFAQSVERMGRQFGELDGAALGRTRELVAALDEAFALPAEGGERPGRLRQAWD